MKVKETTLKSKSIFSDDEKHRLLLHKEWDKKKSKAMIIMINPNTADALKCDTTTMLVTNNLNQLGFGAVDVVNLYTQITSKIHFRFNSDEDLLDPQNNEIILKSAESADKIIIAWGSIGSHNQRIKERQKEVLKLLEPFSEKLFKIGENGYHPLTPIIRNSWKLELFELEEEHDKNDKS